MTQVLSVISGKGGVGKTLLTAALGIQLSRMGKKVYEGKYFVKMRFYGEGYFTLEGNHVDIVSVGHVINM